MEQEYRPVDEVQMVPIDEVEPYKYNVKYHSIPQIRKIAISISSYGWDQPIVVDKDMVIIKGHGRLAAAKLLELKEVPVIVNRDLTEEQVAAARIMDNKSAESEWDVDKLWKEIGEIKDAGIEFKDLGFNARSLSSLFPDKVEVNGKETRKRVQRAATPDASDVDENGYALDPTVPLEQGYIEYFKGDDAWIRKLSLVDFFNYHDKIAVGYSAGKDSTAGLVWLLENCDPEKIFVFFANPGWGVDWPQNLAYARLIEERYGIKIWMSGPSDPAAYGGFEDNLLQMGYPGHAKPCWVESHIKVPRVDGLLKQEGLISRQSGLKVVQMIAIRWAESGDRSKIFPDRGILENGNHYGNPVLRWTDSDLGNFYDERKLKLPPPYKIENRTGCIMCQQGSYAYGVKIRKLLPKHWRRIMEFYALGVRRSVESRLPFHFRKWLLSSGDEKVNPDYYVTKFDELAMGFDELEDELEKNFGERVYLKDPYDPARHKHVRDDLRFPLIKPMGRPVYGKPDDGSCTI